MSDLESETQTQFENASENGENLGLLIDTIQNYEFLFNIAHRDYKNSKAKHLAWEEIALILNSTVETCQKLWKSLRDRFLKEKKTKSGSGAPESSWIHFEQMLFYGRYSKPRKTYTTTARPSTSKWSKMVPDTLLTPVAIVSEEEGGSLESPTPTTSKVSVNTVKPLIRKRKRESDIDAVLDVAQKMCLSLAEDPQKKKPNKTFVDYAFSRLEEMAPEEAELKRKKMLLILEDM